jgi:KDO2-lipid IV(A) lauroyltransferase
MYRFNKNPVWEWLQVSGRQHYFDGVVERQDTRQVLKRLKAGRSIWYAADQDYGAKHSVFAPFFGVPAATITATSRFARLNGSPVVLMTTHRDIRAHRWRIEFHPALSGFPTGDDVADATTINALLEAHIRRQPEQYLWVHKRFKTRPAGEAPVY